MAIGKLLGPVELRTAYEDVKNRIEAAAARRGRRGSDVVCVAVTKTATPDQIRQLIEMGHQDLGENRVQQLTQRVAVIDEFLARRRQLAGAVPRGTSDVPDKVRWHMIGHLQRNKVRQVAPLVQLIHSVDSLRLAEELDALGGKMDRTFDILLQINCSGEAGKFGVASPATIPLAEQIDSMMNLRLRGLMTMAPFSENPEDSRPTFARAAEIFHELRRDKIGGPHCNILSMGMTGDFEVAVEEGANLLRIGRAIFGDVPSDE